MAGQRLIIIDDEEPILFALSAYFGTAGYQVACARRLEEARDMLAKESYACVIADLRLSGIHGVEGLEILSLVREKCPRTRFVLLTAYGSPEVERRAKLSGADAVLQKPVALRALADLVGRLVQAA